MERSIWLPNIFCNCYVYNFKVIPYQIVLHHCAQIISLNQMIWSSVLMTSKTNELSWHKNSFKSLFFKLFLSLNISDFSKNFNHPEKCHSLFPSNHLYKLKSYQALTLWKFGRKFNPLPKEREIHSMKLWSILKKLTNKN